MNTLSPATTLMKTCTKCEVTRPETDFRLRRGKRRAICRYCMDAYGRQWRKDNPDKIRGYNLKYKGYGITLDDYEQMISEQEGRCLICNRERVLVVDHDHETGLVRGLLCQPCNKGLGHFEDDVNRLRAALEYLS